MTVVNGKRALEDLLWSVSSARLFTALPTLPLYDFARAPAIATIQQWLNNDQFSERIGAHFQPLKSTRLGIYYEGLWRFLLQNSHDYDLLAHNLQVIDGANTVGEFDFLYRQAGCADVIHMETAVKFYLGVPQAKGEAGESPVSGSPWNHWVGPGLKDRLDKKLQQLANKQLRLAQRSTAQAVLAACGISTPVKPQLEMAGRFFYPLADMPAPQGSNPSHERGLWLSLTQLQQHRHWLAKGCVLRKLDRNEWFAPVTTTLIDNREGAKNCLAVDDFIDHLLAQLPDKNRFQPFQCVQLQTGGATPHEHSRFFVVPDNWYAQALQAM